MFSVTVPEWGYDWIFKNTERALHQHHLRDRLGVNVINLVRGSNVQGYFFLTLSHIFPDPDWLRRARSRGRPLVFILLHASANLREIALISYLFTSLLFLKLPGLHALSGLVTGP